MGKFTARHQHFRAACSLLQSVRPWSVTTYYLPNYSCHFAL